MTERGITPSQTVGPFFAFALTPGGNYAYSGIVGDDLVTEDTVGAPIVIVGPRYRRRRGAGARRHGRNLAGRRRRTLS